MMKNPLLPPAPLRHQLCGEAMVSEPSLRKFLMGETVQPSTALRILRAAKVLGLEHLMPKPAPTGEQS